MGPEQAQGISRAELAPCLSTLSHPLSMMPQGFYAAGVGCSMVLLSRGKTLCPFKWDLTSDWLFGHPGPELAEENTIVPPKPNSMRHVTTFSILQSLLPLSSKQLTPRASWLAPQWRAILCSLISAVLPGRSELTPWLFVCTPPRWHLESQSKV